MKRIVFGGIAMGLMGASIAAAQPAAQYSTQDIVSTFAAPPASPPAAPAGMGQPASGQAGPAKATCESRGMVTGDDGICEPTKNDRGFNLPTRANPTPARAAPAPARPATTVASSTAPRPAAAQASAPAHRDLLITFKTGSAELTDQAQANAKVFAQAMGMPALAGSRFEIAGYTDSTGSADTNLTLSQQRADAVRSFLVASGVDGSRIAAKGYGATDFADPAQPEAAANRRVEARRVN